MEDFTFSNEPIVIVALCGCGWRDLFFSRKHTFTLVDVYKTHCQVSNNDVDTFTNILRDLKSSSLQALTFGVCWAHAVTLRHAAAVGACGIGAVGGGHGWPSLAEEDPRCHGLRPSWWLDRSSIELVVCQAAVLGVQIVLRRATVLREFRGLLHY